MIFYGHADRRAESPPSLGTGNCQVLNPYKRSMMPIWTANHALARRAESLPVKVQVELESRLTARRGSATNCDLALGDIISHIPILVDVRRISQ